MHAAYARSGRGSLDMTGGCHKVQACLKPYLEDNGEDVVGGDLERVHQRTLPATRAEDAQLQLPCTGLPPLRQCMRTAGHRAGTQSEVCKCVTAKIGEESWRCASHRPSPHCDIQACPHSDNLTAT